MEQHVSVSEYNKNPTKRVGLFIYVKSYKTRIGFYKFS